MPGLWGPGLVLGWEAGSPDCNPHSGAWSPPFRLPVPSGPRESRRHPGSPSLWAEICGVLTASQQETESCG